MVNQNQTLYLLGVIHFKKSSIYFLWIQIYFMSAFPLWLKKIAVIQFFCSL